MTGRCQGHVSSRGLRRARLRAADLPAPGPQLLTPLCARGTLLSQPACLWSAMTAQLPGPRWWPGKALLPATGRLLSQTGPRARPGLQAPSAPAPGPDSSPAPDSSVGSPRPAWSLLPAAAPLSSGPRACLPASASGCSSRGLPSVQVPWKALYPSVLPDWNPISPPALMSPCGPHAPGSGPGSLLPIGL